MGSPTSIPTSACCWLDSRSVTGSESLLSCGSSTRAWWQASQRSSIAQAPSAPPRSPRCPAQRALSTLDDRAICSVVTDLHEVAVGVAEIDRLHRAECAITLDRAHFDGDMMLSESLHHIRQWHGGDQAEVG